MRRAVTCACGSDLYRRPVYDAAGIFVTYVCDKCEVEKLDGYDPAIFDSYSTYAVTKNEDDIGRYPDEDY